jgi:hypothetical protein
MGDDCKDWSKLLGLSFFPAIFARRNSIMLGWRHNPETDYLEVTPYGHLSNGEAKYVNEVAIDVVPDIDYILEIDLEKKTMAIYKESEEPLEGHFGATFVRWRLLNYYTKATWVRRQINSWFGGNKVTPQTFELYIKQL